VAPFPPGLWPEGLQGREARCEGQMQDWTTGTRPITKGFNADRLVAEGLPDLGCSKGNILRPPKSAQPSNGRGHVARRKTSPRLGPIDRCPSVRNQALGGQEVAEDNRSFLIAQVDVAVPLEEMATLWRVDPVRPNASRVCLDGARRSQTRTPQSRRGPTAPAIGRSI
jgi:hypothetical protein